MSLKSILRGDGAVSVINRKWSRRMRRSRPFTLAIDTAVSGLISAPTRTCGGEYVSEAVAYGRSGRGWSTVYS